MRNLTLLFSREMQDVHLKKDVGRVPLHLQNFGFESKLVYYSKPQKNNIESKKIKLLKLRPILGVSSLLGRGQETIKILAFSKYLILNFKKIDALMFIHLNLFSVVLGSLFQFLKKKSFIYIKLDMNDKNIPKQSTFLITNFMTKRFLNNVDLISCETQSGYEKIKNDFLGVDISEKLMCIPNGYEKEESNTISIEKEKLIVFVGRVGCYQKNTEQLLRILPKVKWNGWKIKIIGPIEETFKEKIEPFFKENDFLKSTVVFTGSINDSQKLLVEYQKAKVFLLNSRYEGFPLVFLEALQQGHYFICTNVSGAEDVIEKNINGVIVDVENDESLLAAINKVTQDDFNFEVAIKKSKELSKRFTWQKIIEENKALKERFKSL